MGAAVGAGIGGVIGAVAGLIAAMPLTLQAGDSKDSARRAVTTWKKRYPGFDRAPDLEIFQAIDASNNTIMGVGAVLGTFLGSIIGAKIGCPAAQPPGTGTSGLPIAPR
jgi:hypothetical protein